MLEGGARFCFGGGHGAWTAPLYYVRSTCGGAHGTDLGGGKGAVHETGQREMKRGNGKREMDKGIGIWELGNKINYSNKATTSAGGIALPISRVATTRPVGKWNTRSANRRNLKNFQCPF